MLYRISVTERGLTGIANIFRSRLSRLDDLLGAGTVPLSLATVQLPRRFRCPQSRYPARISCLTFDLFVTVQKKRNIVFLRIQACLFPTIASTGLNGSKTEANSNILSQTVTCKCEDKRR